MRRSRFLTLLLVSSPLLFGIGCQDSGLAPVADQGQTPTKGSTGGGTVTANPEIAFTENHPKVNGVAGYVYALSVMDANGANRTQVYAGGNYVRQPAWSPDGRKIAFCEACLPTNGGNAAYSEIMVTDISLVKDARGNTLPKASAPRRLTFAGNQALSYLNPTWSEDGSTIYFIESHRSNPGPDEICTSSILSVPAAGGPVSTVYTVTTPGTSIVTFAGLRYNTMANEFALRKTTAQRTYDAVSGTWTTSSSVSELSVLVFDPSTATWSFDPSRAWAGGIPIDWSHSWRRFIFYGQNGTNVTDNVSGSTPFLVSTTVVRPAWSTTDTKYVGLNSSTREVSVVDFGGATTVVTPIAVLSANSGADMYIDFSWKRIAP